MGIRSPRFLGCRDPLTEFARSVLREAQEPADDGHDTARRASGRPIADLERARVVVPTARAQRLVLDALVRMAAECDVVLVPPRILLPHEVAGVLCEAPKEACAPRAAVAIALEEELRRERAEGVSAREVRSIVDAAIELAGWDLGFAAVATAAARHDGDPERYLAIDRALQTTRERLQSVGLRLEFDEQPVAFRVAIDVVHLIGVTEFNKRLRAVLESGPRVAQPWVIADPVDSSRFDRIGALVPDAWRRRPPVVPRDRIQLAAGPREQAETAIDAVAAIAAGSADTVSADEVLLVAADPELAPWIAREFRASGLGVHDARGVELGRLPPLRVLGRIRELESDASTASLRRLLGLIAVESAVESERVKHFDSWRTTHLDRRMGEGWLQDTAGTAELEPLVERLSALLDRLPKRATLAHFASALSEWLGEVFALAIETSARSMIAQSVQVMTECLGEIAAVPAMLLQPMDRVAALDWLCAWMGDQRVREAPRRDELELVGWLELLFDPAPATVIVGMNEGCVPSAKVDSLLTDSLRQTLGLPTGESRLARDGYVLGTALERGPVTVVLGRKDAAGDPLAPSRLLLTGEGEDLADRVTALFGDLPVTNVERGGDSAFGRVLPPSGPCALDELRVTAFRDYIHCPYRFWLRHVQRIEPVVVPGSDFDARTSGILVHEVLQGVGEAILAGHAKDPARLTACLDAELDRALETLAGAGDGGLLRLQRRFFRARLLPFVECQVALGAEGWEIAALECDLRSHLDMGEEDPLRIRGRVDRIDKRREGEGWRLRVIDYKTGDDATTPDRAIDKEGIFRDLQLSLYRHMVEQVDDAVREAWFGDAHARIVAVETGYFAIAAKSAETRFYPAKRVDEHFDDAIMQAREIVRAIRRGEFAINPRGSFGADDPLELVCRTAVLDASEDGPEGEDE